VQAVRGAGRALVGDAATVFAALPPSRQGVDLERHAAAVEALRLAQEAETPAADLPRVRPPAPFQAYRDRAGVGLAVDQIEIDIVGVSLLALERAGVDRVDGERQRQAPV